jgi:galacturan 1,4-alpha-galacturonidase
MKFILIFGVCLHTAAAKCILSTSGSQAQDGRPLCVVETSRNETDSGPALHDCLSLCGDGGVIRFLYGSTYTLGSTWNFTGCNGCEVQVEGTIRATNDSTYWFGQASMLSISGARDVVITSRNGTGLIDGNGSWLYNSSCCQGLPNPVLFRISNSSRVIVSNLTLKGAPRDFISVQSGSSHTSLSSLKLIADGRRAFSRSDPDRVETGFWISRSSNVTISDTVVSFASRDQGSKVGSCVSFSHSADGVLVKDLECHAALGAVVRFDIDDGKNNSLVVLTSERQTGNVSNIRVFNATMDTDYAAGLLTHNYALMNATNLVWENIKVGGGSAVVVRECWGADGSTNCWNWMSSHAFIFSEIYFTNFTGNLDLSQQQINCPNDHSICDFHFENWQKTK